MSRYKLKTIYVWSRELAYLAGLFASDGCLLNNGRHLNITSKDLQIIQSCQDILGKFTKIGTKIGQFQTKAYYWQFSDVALYEFFYDAGIKPRKSTSIKEVKVPDMYWADFLRGYFDGDGTTYGYIDKRWTNARMYYVGFVSASNDFITWLALKNKNLINTKGHSIRNGARANTLVYAKSDSVKIYNYMYSEDTVFKKYSLDRKRHKLEYFIKLG
jgi:hypothetical protein